MGCQQYDRSGEFSKRVIGLKIELSLGDTWKSFKVETELSFKQSESYLENTEVSNAISVTGSGDL
jgi:hypothetical protein